MSTGKRRPQRLIEPTALCYVGRGAALLDVPARDLSAEEAAEFDVATLLASGLYEAMHEALVAAPDKERTDGTGA